MSKTTLYLSVEEALSIHTQMLEAHGGAPGVRDMGLLESALVRPRSGYYETLSLQAAALMQSLARNHAFLDGNKRAAFGFTYVFLRINGWRLAASADDAESFLIERVIRGHAEIDEIATWLEAHLVRV